MQGDPLCFNKILTSVKNECPKVLKLVLWLISPLCCTLPNSCMPTMLNTKTSSRSSMLTFASDGRDTRMVVNSVRSIGTELTRRRMLQAHANGNHEGTTGDSGFECTSKSLYAPNSSA